MRLSSDEKRSLTSGGFVLLFLVLMFAFAVIVTPAETNQVDQSYFMKRSLELQKEQNYQLTRIANSLEKIRRYYLK